jgi:hypothetical protein
MRPSTIEFLVNERPHKERGATRLSRWCQALPYKCMSLWRSHNGMATVLSFQTSCLLAHVLSMMGTGFASIFMEKRRRVTRCGGFRPSNDASRGFVGRFLPRSIPGPRAVESFGRRLIVVYSRRRTHNILSR